MTIALTAPDVALGDELRDRITGFQGVCVGLVHYISGCDQALLSPPVKGDGSKSDGAWFDLDRLEIVSPAKFARATQTRGHDAPAPIR